MGIISKSRQLSRNINDLFAGGLKICDQSILLSNYPNNFHTTNWVCFLQPPKIDGLQAKITSIHTGLAHFNLSSSPIGQKKLVASLPIVGTKGDKRANFTLWSRLPMTFEK